MPYQCEKCGREWNDQTAIENEFLCTRTCGGRLVLRETPVEACPERSRREHSESPGVSAPVTTEQHTRCPADSRGVVHGKKFLPLIPKLPSTLALVLDEYTREENDYIALHAMCAALEFTARFLTIIVLADLWREGKEFPEKLRKQLCMSFNLPTLGG
jgi:DNA-directed RNA polymerase subunit RPC12/RpoP